MMRSLRFKWMTTLLLTSLLGVFLVGIFASQTTLFAYDQFRIEQAQEAFVTDVTMYYEENGAWDGLQDWLIGQEPLPEMRRMPLPPQLFVLANSNRVVVAGFGPLKAGDVVPAPMFEEGVPLTVDGSPVGRALMVQMPPRLDPLEQRYIDSVNRALLLGTVGSSSVALLIGLLLSGHFLRPLRELTQAITAVQQGNLEQQVQVRTNDELGLLAQAFNRMSIELHRANQLRKQMTADIAHDLRTPLMVISGYLEALRDGTLVPTIERFEAMNQEAVLLKRLIDDLRTLSLADAGELPLMPQPVSPRELLEKVRDSFAPIAHEQQITLRVDVADNLPSVWMDRERMTQVLGNLVSNALRYTDAGGSITLQGCLSEDQIELVVCDTGKGIAEDKLPNIFERFYRADESRYQNEGESGLGLAIAKAIVEAHQGTIRAESRVGAGTTMIIRLPIAVQEPRQKGLPSKIA